MIAYARVGDEPVDVIQPVPQDRHAEGGRQGGQPGQRARRADHLQKVFRPDTSAQSFVAKTPADLGKALKAPNDTLVFVESVMDPYDLPAAIATGSNSGADLEYGPRGPQHRDNAQVRPA